MLATAYINECYKMIVLDLVKHSPILRCSPLSWTPYINNCIITDPEKIEEIRAYVQRSERDKYLCKKLSEFPDFKAIYRYLVENAAEHNVHMLTNPPPYRGVFFYDR